MTKEGLIPATGISIEAIGLIEASVSPNTLRAYHRAIRQLDAWRGDNAVTDAVLADYIASLHEGGKSPATITQVVAAVRWAAKMQGISVVGQLTARTLSGIRRKGRGRGRGQVDGLTWETVDKVCELAESDGTLSGLRDAALIRLMSDALLRISEAIAVNVEHLDGNTLFIPQSKTDTEGRGELLFIGDTTQNVIKNYLKKAAISEGAVFRRVRWYHHIGEGRITDQGARAAIQMRAKEAGVEGFISGHSLRIGSAVSLAQAGASLVEMQVAGRWKSPNMPAHYAKAEFVKQGAVARYRYRKELEQ